MSQCYRHRLLRLLRLLGVVLLLAVGLPSPMSLGEDLARLEFRIVGAQLRVTPEFLSVPKGVAGSVAVELGGVRAGTDLETVVVEGTLRGPSFPARRIVGPVNEPLLLPPLNLVGDYELSDIKLVDAVTGDRLLEASPNRVPINVFDEVLVSRVTSRPLTLDEIQERGIVIDENNFKALEFEVGFVLDGQTIPVKFPVVAPSFKQTTEIIPAAELEARLAEADSINQDIAGSFELPKELETARANIQVQGINFQRVDVGETDLALQIPPIPALMVIPGNVGFLNQFFSVQIFTENAAPSGSGLSVTDVDAELLLPAGPDRVPATDYSEPGDDPLRFARVGPDAIIEPIQRIARPGADGQFGTPDDIERLNPGETGQAEFLVEGLQEGLHIMNLELTANLEGLAAGVVQIKGKAAGSVLVRNPKFSLAFAHPRTTRAGEPYEASVTVLNTSSSVANLVRVSLRASSISGGVLTSAETVELGNLDPGESATAVYRVRAQRTGAISFSNLTTSEEGLVGRFRLRMGVDERGVGLSPDTITMPDFVDELPEAVLNAANRVLGQALSVVTAGQLPPGIKGVRRSVITRRVLELAEAGQRIRYGDAVERVLGDLLLDWQGGRGTDPGLDQIIRDTNAGRDFRLAIFRAMEAADALDAANRLAARAGDYAGRSEFWEIVGSSNPGVELAMITEKGVATVEGSLLPGATGYRGASGSWLANLDHEAKPSFLWRFDEAVADATLAYLFVDSQGMARSLQWRVENVPADGGFAFDPDADGRELRVDLDFDGTFESSIPGDDVLMPENPPELISAIQDPLVKVGRPPKPCLAGEFGNYGNAIAVLFSKPMTQAQVNQTQAYRLDNGVTAGFVRIQPGARVALLTMNAPLGAIVPRTLNVSGILDARGNAIVESTVPVQSEMREGVSMKGRVVRADGSPARGVPVTLTFNDENENGIQGCLPFVVRVTQVFTDDAGMFDFDFVLAGVPYSISATDTSGLSSEAVDLILESSRDGEVVRDKLLELASQPSVQNTLLESFSLGALPAAIAAAEGLDRALIRDLVDIGSPRLGTEVPVALRFRGRGLVQGRVLGSNGVSPVSGAAVNLYPDPDSRELGRGIFTDDNGRFAFAGVPLGNYTIEARSQTGLSRTQTGIVLTPGEIIDDVIVLSEVEIPRSALRGRVLENDGVTPHAGANLLVGQFNDSRGRFEGVVASVRTDAEGFWEAENIPVNTYDLVALSIDGKRKGDRRDVGVVPGTTNQATVVLQGFGEVFGRVETSTGVPVGNAIVGGGSVLVRTDEEGRFTLDGVPTGTRTISAAVERSVEGEAPKSTPAFSFTRVGSASVNVLPAVDNFVVIRLSAVGRIVGRVIDAAGEPVPSVRVALPETGGFRWVEADDEGRYQFEGLPLKKYTVSAPAPVAADTDTGGLVEAIRTGSEEEVLAAVGEAFEIFTGVNDPFLNGQGDNFNPLTWGFADVNLNFDGQTAVADIRYLREGTISGIVLNGQGVPIGARVRLTGLGPLRNGKPGTILRGERNSDPATGVFEFPGQALAGNWGLQSASPFFPDVITTQGRTTAVEPDVTGIVLQFPPVRETNGRLAGTIFQPDGNPAGANVEVKISFGDDFVIRTEEDGRYDTQIDLPAFNQRGEPRGYRVEAFDPATDQRGVNSVVLQPGDDNVADVVLLGRGDVRVRVLQADGTPADKARVTFRQAGFPRDVFEGESDAAGDVQFSNAFEGGYSVCAQWASGPTQLFGRRSVTVRRGETVELTVTLEATGLIRGTFVERDRLTPVAAAQVAVGRIGFATTDDAGRFEVIGVPLGTYRLTSNNPVTGRGALESVTVEFDGQIRDITLVEQALGEIAGTVINSFGDDVVAGASVTLTVSDGGFTPARTVSTGPDGSFRFPGAPAGGFSLQARDSLSGLRGSRSGTLPEDQMLFQIDIPLQPLASVSGTVLLPDGQTPAGGVTVRLGSGRGSVSTDTDAAGRVTFSNLPLKSYQVTAVSNTPGQTRSVGFGSVTLETAGVAPDFAVTLAGVGAVEGQVFQSDGVTPAEGIEVEWVSEANIFRGVRETVLTDELGAYRFVNVPVGNYRLRARDQALGVSESGEIVSDGSVETIGLVLSESGTVNGRLVRADGLTPVSGIEVLINFKSVSGLPGRAISTTDGDGRFAFENVTLGEFRLEAIHASVAGIARHTGQLTANGELLDVGDLVLDEADPTVLAVTPSMGSSEIPTTVAVELVFSEALDPDRIDPNGIYLQGVEGVVAATLAHESDDEGRLRIVRLTPESPLMSEQSYQVVVIDDRRLNATGGLIGLGPVDLVGRPLVVPFLSTFTTADNDPPVLLSATPEDGTIQVDPRAVVRLSFNEPIRSEGIKFELSDDSGVVPSGVSVGSNDQVLVLTPGAPLMVNQAYQYRIEGVLDLAGNAMLEQPVIGRFVTLDTLGPSLVPLAIVDDKPPIAGTTIEVETDLVAAEDEVTVRFLRGFDLLGEVVEPPFRTRIDLPDEGNVIVRAVAFDRFGNEGPLAELAINAVANQAPELQFVRINPPDGPVLTGSLFVLDVAATDDSAVAQLRAIASGAVESSVASESGDRLRLQGQVPEDVGPAQSITIFAEATDDSGLSSGETTFELPIADGTRPTVTIVSPEAGTLFEPGAAVSLEVAASDGFGVTRLTVEVNGAFEVNLEETLESPLTETTRTLEIPIPQATIADGSDFFVSVRAEDAAENLSLSVALSLRMRDSLAPQVVSVNLVDGAQGVEVLPEIVVDFSESIAPETVNDQSVTLEAVGDGPVPINRLLSDDGLQLVVSSQGPLEQDAEHQFNITTGLADLFNNALSEAVSIQFRTGSFSLVEPQNGTQIIEGQILTLTAASREDIGLESVRFLVNGEPIETETDSPFSVGYTVPSLDAVGDGILTVVAEGLSDNEEVLATATAAVTVLALSDDTDGDGMINETELLVGTDPFRPDAALDPDGDGVVTGEEIAGGTDPFRADTDGDSHGDGVDVDPLIANQLPVIGEAIVGSALRFDGNDYVDIGTHDVIRAGAGTIEMSFQVETLEGVHHLFYVGQNGDGFGSQSEFHIHVSDGQIGWVNHEGSRLWTLSGGRLEAGRLHHVAVTWDGELGAVRLYLDGALLDEGEYRTFNRSWHQVIRLGRHTGTGFPERGFTGLIDHLRIWQRARSQQEIREYLAREVDWPDTDLVSQMTFDRGRGDRVLDHAPNTFDGLLGAGEARPEWVASPLALAARLDPVCATVGVAALVNVPVTDDEDLSYEVVALPSRGQLFQTTDGVNPSDLIEGVPAAITHPDGQLLYLSDTTDWISDVWTLQVDDGQDVAQVEVSMVRQPISEAPQAVDDAFVGFEGVPLVLSDMLANDQVSEGEPLRVLRLTQPSNGTVVLNDRGEYTYTANQEFAGTDSLEYLVAGEVGWLRELDYDEGLVRGAFGGNPARDHQGREVWSAYFVQGGASDSEDPWFENRGSLMVWDDNYFDVFGTLWARGDDLTPAVSATALTHVLNSGGDASFIPLVRWTSPFDGLSLDLSGSLGVLWSGTDDVGSPVPVEVVIAKIDRGTGETITLLLETLEKPQPEDSVGDFAGVPVDLSNVEMNKGDEFVFSVRAKEAIDNRWVIMLDSVAIVPDLEGQTAQVVINLGENAAPIALGLEPETGVTLDGDGDSLVATHQQLAPETSVTLSTWFLATDDFQSESTPNSLLTMGGDENGGTCAACLFLSADRQLGFSVTSEAGETTMLTSRPVSNGWHHVSAVLDAASQLVLLYVDGRLVDRLPHDGPIRPGGDTWVIGGWGENQAARSWRGVIDEVAVWNRPLSGEEIKERVSQVLVPRGERSLLAYWRFSENDGTQSTDLTSNQWVATFMGDTSWGESWAPFAEAVSVAQDSGVTFRLEGQDPDGDAVQALVSQLPLNGDLLELSESEGDQVERPVRDYVFAESVQNGVLREVYSGIGGTELRHLFDAAIFPDEPTSVEILSDAFESPVNVSDNYGQRLSAYLDPPEDGFYTFWFSSDDQGSLQLSLSAHPRRERTIASVPQWSSSRQWDKFGSQQSALIFLRAGTLYSIMGLAKEGSGGDNLAVRWQLPSGEIEEPIPGSRLWTPDSVIVLDEIPVSAADGTLIYRPDPGFSGVDFLEFVVTDGKIASDSGIVPVRVMPVNREPTGEPESFNALESQPQFLNDLLANDTDPDGDRLFIATFEQPANGTLEPLGGDDFQYTSHLGFSGIDTFVYRVGDGGLVSDPITVSIDVSPLDGFRWINPDGGDWSQAENWSQGAVPGAADSAVIDMPGDYEVLVNANTTVARLILGADEGEQTLRLTSRTLSIGLNAVVSGGGVFDISGGVLDGGGIVAIESRLRWTGGTMRGRGEMRIGGEGTSILGGNRKELNRRFVNEGRCEWLSGHIRLAGGTFHNAEGGTVIASVGGNIQWNGGTNRVINEGLWQKTGDESLQVNSGVLFENHGDVEVLEGSLVLSGGGTSRGRVRLTEGTSLSFTDNNGQWTATSEITGGGNVSFTGGTTAINGAFTVTGETRVSGGRAGFGGENTIPRLVQTGGTIEGGGVLIVSEHLLWSGGIMRGSGETRLGEQGSLIMDGNRKDLGRRFVNEGQGEWRAGPLRLAGGTFVNAPTGVIQSSVEGTAQWNGGTNRVVNEGTWQKIGEGQLQVNSGVLLENSGTIEVLAGAFVVSGGGTSSGQLIIAEGSEAVFSDNTGRWTEDSMLSGAGRLRVTGGNTAFNGAYRVTGETVVTGGRVGFGAMNTIPRLTQSGGTVEGSGGLNITEHLQWTGGLMRGGGETLIAQEATATLEGGRKDLGRRLVVAGMAAWRAGQLRFSGGTFVVAPTGVFEASVAGNLQWNGGTNRFINEGVFLKVGEGDLQSNSGVSFDNSGIVNVHAGTLILSGAGTSTGTFDLAEGSVVRVSDNQYVLAEGSTVQGEGLLQLTAGTLTVNGALALTRFEQVGGRLDGSGRLVATVSLRWTGGNMHGSGETGVSTTGMLILEGNRKDLNRRLVNEGQCEWRGGHIRMAGGTLVNAEGGTLEASLAGSVQWNGGVNRVINDGLWRKTGEGQLQFNSGVLLENHGVIELNLGELLVSGGGTSTGIISVAAETHLIFSNNASTWTDDSEIIGAGNVRFTGGTTAINGTYSIAGETRLTGGRAGFGGDVSVPSYVQTGGTLEGAGGVIFTGQSTWSGGTMAGAGETRVDDSATFILEGARKDLNRRLVNGGRCEWRAGPIRFAGGTLVNASVMVASLEGNLQWNGGTNRFINEGLFQKTGEGTLQANSGVAFDNSGLLEVRLGVLRWSGSGTNSGVIDLSEGTQLSIGNNQYNFVEGATASGNGTIRLEGSTLRVNADLSVPRFEQTGGTLNGAGALVATQHLRWTGGTMSGAGVTRVGSQATMVLAGGRKDLNRPLLNEGQGEWREGHIRLAGGTLTNAVGAILEVAAAANVQWNGGTNQVINEGELRKIGDGVLQVNDGVVFHSNGVLKVLAGELRIAGGGTQSGNVQVDEEAVLVIFDQPFVFNPGTSFSGSGTVRIQVVTTFNADLSLGATQFLIEGSGRLNGAFEISNVTGGVLSIGTSMSFASMRIGGTLRLANENINLTVHGPLVLESTGTIDNPGQIVAREFSNLGGTLLGNPILISDDEGEALRISEIIIESLPSRERRRLSTAPENHVRLVLRWQYDRRAKFVLERSLDFKTWRPEPVLIKEPEPGKYRAHLFVKKDAAWGFLRLRRIITDPVSVSVRDPLADTRARE